MPLEFCRIEGGARWTGSGRPDYERFKPSCAGDVDSGFPMTEQVLRFFELSN